MPEVIEGVILHWQFQSALAPKDERYRRTWSRTLGLPCFNPLSPRRTRDTGDQHLPVGPFGVSIRSRPEGREIRASANVVASFVPFQSALAPKDERY